MILSRICDREMMIVTVFFFFSLLCIHMSYGFKAQCNSANLTCYMTTSVDVKTLKRLFKFLFTPHLTTMPLSKNAKLYCFLRQVYKLNSIDTRVDAGKIKALSLCHSCSRFNGNMFFFIICFTIASFH